MVAIDVVVVSYNSRAHLRNCVEQLCKIPDVSVIVVDNASSDESVAVVDDLPVHAIQRSDNGGFAVGCNTGWRSGSAPLVLFLNPDASLDERSLRRLAEVLGDRPTVGAAAPRIEYPDGSLAYSLRRFPRLRSTYSQALFLHRLFRESSWSDEIVKEESVYSRAWEPEWASGACLMVKRDVLEAIGGWDEAFFLYGEDVDLCLRLRDSGLRIQFEPDAIVVHHEGASSPTGAALPLLAAARLRFARKHFSPLGSFLERTGVALWALTHVVVARGGIAVHRGHARALRVAITGDLTGGRADGH